MKTLSDFKRALTIGVKVHTVWHREFAGRGENGIVLYRDKDMGIRPVSIVKSSQVAFKTDRGTDSWLVWPKASDCKIEGNTVQVYEEGNLILTYTLID